MATKKKATTKKKSVDKAKQKSSTDAGEDATAEAPGEDEPPKAPDPNIKIEKFTRELTVALTREELEEVAQSMSHKLAERDIREAEIKERQKRDKSLLKDMETELRRFGNVIRDRSELREIACERRLDYNTGRVTDVRLDSGAILSERDMTELERQKPLGLPEDDLDDEFNDDVDADEPGVDDQDEAAE